MNFPWNYINFSVFNQSGWDLWIISLGVLQATSWALKSWWSCKAHDRNRPNDQDETKLFPGLDLEGQQDHEQWVFILFYFSGSGFQVLFGILNFYGRQRVPCISWVLSMIHLGPWGGEVCLEHVLHVVRREVKIPWVWQKKKKTFPGWIRSHPSCSGNLVKMEGSMRICHSSQICSPLTGVTLDAPHSLSL